MYDFSSLCLLRLLPLQLLFELSECAEPALSGLVKYDADFFLLTPNDALPSATRAVYVKGQQIKQFEGVS